jgi:hypothetical protein
VIENEYLKAHTLSSIFSRGFLCAHPLSCIGLTEELNIIGRRNCNICNNKFLRKNYGLRLNPKAKSAL